MVYDWLYCRMVRKMLNIIGVILLALAIQANAKTLYVSKAYGNDLIINGSNTCRNMTSPCKTLLYVINKASSNDVIMVDSTNTTLEPYDNCFWLAFRINLSFKSWKGSALINCAGDRLVFNGSGNAVHFEGMRFINTFMRLNNVSLAVTNCSFGSFLLNTTYMYIIDVSAKSSDINVTVTSSRFVETNSAGCIQVANFAGGGVFLEIGNSSILNNSLNRVGSLISIIGQVSFTFVNSEISNTQFPKYVYQRSVVWFNTNVFIKTAVSELKNGTVGNCTSNQDDDPSLSVYILGANFYGNMAKIISATFNSSARVLIVDTTISGSSANESAGGAIVLTSGNDAQSLEVHFKNSWFTFNRKLSFSSLVNIRTSESVVTNISLERCYFNSNTNNLEDGYLGTGPIVYIKAQRLVLSVLSCKFHLNQAGAVYIATSPYSSLNFTHILVSSCSYWNDVYNIFGGMISVNFYNSSKWNVPLKFNVWIQDSEFYNNTARLTGSGAIEIRSVSTIDREICYGSVGSLSIRRSIFTRNLASLGTGGIYISAHCNCDISHTVFRENAGSEAGAIYFTGGNLVLRNCVLDSNYGGYTTSTLASGSLRLTEKGNASIQDSRIIQGKIFQSFGLHSTFHGGVSMSSSAFGSINVLNSSFDYLWGPSVEKTIVMEIAQIKKFMLDNATVIRCPHGYNIRKRVSGVSNSGISFECRLCSMDSYSIDRGTYTLPRQHHIRCLQCPYGAKCMKGLQALPNFWGYSIVNSSPPMIAFLRCPLGYCCEPGRHQTSCVPYNICNSQRNGTLCGECRAGFSETLFTPSCRKSEKCNDYWFWPLAVIFVFGFSMYLVVQPDFVTILWNLVTWFSRRPTQVLADDNKVLNPGFERIVFFYYQATDVLLVQSSFDVWDKYLSQFILGLFNFEIRVNKEGFACPFPGLTPVTKVFFHSLGVFSVLVAIPFIFMCHWLLCYCLRRETPKTGSYLAAFFKGVFLGYAVLAAKSMKLLKCVTVNGVSCLFLNCNIHCYTWWQSLLFTLVGIYFVPFVLVLFFGSYKLLNKKLSVLQFILACYFPLPFLSYWFITRQAFRTKYVPDSEGRDAITSLLIGSYRVPDHVNSGAIYWESILIGRMLILILANVLIKEPFLRSLTLLFICIINLSFHIYVLPFELVSANRAETISLFGLVLMAMFNLPFMGYLSEGVVPSGPISDIMKIFSWCQAVLVGFLPCLCILLILAALLSQAVRLVYSIAKCLRCAYCMVRCRRFQRDREELVDPLIST